MLIRKPVEQVFNAFIDPEITTNFWFTKSSGKLQPGRTLTWEWEMYGISIEVFILEIIPDKKISMQWGNPATYIDYEFTELGPEKTYVTIKNYGFTETGAELIEAIKDSTGGFTTVLDGLKAWLECGIKLNLIADKFPKEISSHKS